MSETEAGANETGAGSGFQVYPVEFHNRGVKLAGSLLLPRAKNGCQPLSCSWRGPQTVSRTVRQVSTLRKWHRALIYDKRGVGQSGGAYEGREPYEIWSMTLLRPSPS